jgi:starch phosphorylase
MHNTTSWYHKTYGDAPSPVAAYFSTEFGLTDCIPNYSGGLGVLSGDHMKSASDLGLPLAGVGLLYQQGYFQQYLTADGWQMESYPVNNFSTMPLTLERGPNGAPIQIEVAFPGRTLKAQVWRVRVGRTPLFLLDANVLDNRPDDRAITNQLYGGDSEMRICQEILLGIGGLRALHAVGVEPLVCHMNEGHSAFMALERIRLLMQNKGLSFAEAREATTAGNVFTTHTPVPAGIDLFSAYLMDKYFGDYYPALGISRDQFFALGRISPGSPDEPFNMAVLALRLSSATNGVSKLHGGVARRMWQSVWPALPEKEIPISSVTNGIHTQSWVSHDMADLLDRYIGPSWQDDPADATIWRRIADIPDEELWRTHERRRERLTAFTRQRLRAQLDARGVAQSEVEKAKDALNPEAITIGFARRFATYKRAALLFRNPERLARILNDKARPVQIIFAGKAHPMDLPAKELIKQVVQLTGREEFRRRIVFLENYDMMVARYMVQGVDVWLNTPRRYMEASGTSGMKAAANGAINMSVLDGWWDEAYTPEVGWAIGKGEVYDDFNYQDDLESNAIYDLLEKEVIPLFYERGDDGLPRDWIAKMKATMQAICPVFNTSRMVREYAEVAYMPQLRRYTRLAADDFARAKELARWKARLAESWRLVRVVGVTADAPDEIKVGAQIAVRAVVHVGGLQAQDVTVELYHGMLDARGDISEGNRTPMALVEQRGDGDHLYEGAISTSCSGRYGYTVRVLPQHEDMGSPYETGMVTWAQ